jgi:hypothetical protein
MTEVLLYTCPTCEASSSANRRLVNINGICPNCTHEFSATPLDSSSDFQLPESVPFFKCGKLKIFKKPFLTLEQFKRFKKYLISNSKIRNGH